MPLSLVYFETRGLAEASRLALVDAGEPHTNVYKARADGSWPTYKESATAAGILSFGQMPVLLVDGGPSVVQSKAILRHIGRAYDLYGSTEVERCNVGAWEPRHRILLCYPHGVGYACGCTKSTLVRWLFVPQGAGLIPTARSPDPLCVQTW